MASAPTEIIAMAASPLIFVFWPVHKRRIAQIIVMGRVRIMRSVRPTTAAMAIAPNATCERPSPIYENLFNTRITPSSDEHSAISTPTMSAYLTNGYEKYEINVLMMVMTSLQILRAGS